MPTGLNLEGTAREGPDCPVWELLGGIGCGSRSGSDLRWGLRVEPSGNWACRDWWRRGTPGKNEEQQLKGKADTKMVGGWIEL